MDPSLFFKLVLLVKEPNHLLINSFVLKRSTNSFLSTNNSNPKSSRSISIKTLPITKSISFLETLAVSSESGKFPSHPPSLQSLSSESILLFHPNSLLPPSPTLVTNVKSLLHSKSNPKFESGPSYSTTTPPSFLAIPLVLSAFTTFKLPLLLNVFLLISPTL